MVLDIIGYDRNVAKLGILAQLLCFFILLCGVFGGAMGVIFSEWRFLLSDSFLSIPFYLGALVISILGIWLILKDRRWSVYRVGFRLCYYSSKNNYDKALKAINKKIEEDYLGYMPNWFNLKAMVLLDKGDLEEAEKILNDLEEKYPNFLQMLHYRACLESKKGNIKKSEVYLKRLYEVQQRWLENIKNPVSRGFKKKSFKNYVKRLKNDKCFENLRKNSDIDPLLFMFSKQG